MRWRGGVLTALLVVSCGYSDSGCGPIELSEAAGFDRADCGLTLEYEGVKYTPWCVGVQERWLGPVVASGSDVEYMHYEARSIEGIPSARALAIAEVRTDREHRKIATRCGRWQFTPANDLSTKKARELASLVVNPGALD